jgi:hypothetical protein
VEKSAERDGTRKQTEDSRSFIHKLAVLFDTETIVVSAGNFVD